MGLGDGLLVAAVLVIAVLYLWRGRKCGQLLVGVVGTAWLIAVAVALVVAATIVLGWADPNPSVFLSGLGAAAGGPLRPRGQRRSGPPPGVLRI